MDHERINNIPDIIKASDRWICMKLLPDKLRPGYDKKNPVNPFTGYNASSTDPATWGSFQQANNAIEKFNCDGIGFVLGDGVFGVDIDNCVVNGQIDPEAQKIIDQLDSYTEFSLSGNGIHILAFGEKPDWFKRCKLENFNGNGSCLEIYDGSRYFVMTGKRHGDRSMRNASTDLESLAKKYWSDEVPERKPLYANTIGISGHEMGFSDEDVIIRAKNAKDGESFNDQFNGANPISNGDVSANDLSFCSKIARFTKDSNQIDRIFRRSKRIRPKWDEVHYSTGETYGEHTVQIAIEGTQRIQRGPLDWKAIERPLTDLDVAREFSAIMTDKLAYSDARGWLSFDGKLWLEDGHQAYKLLSSHIDGICNEAGHAIANAQSDQQKTVAQRFSREAHKLRSTNRIEACLKLAKHELHVHDDKFDTQFEMLNAPDGAIDLKTGQIRPAKPEDYCTAMTGCGIVSDEKAKQLWLDFLSKVTDGDEEYQQYLQVVMGQALIGKVYRENLIIAHGSGGNGKSTFFNAIFKVCGTYAMGIDPDVLLATRKNNDPSLASLKGKRFVLASETEEGQRFSTAQLKRICSTDSITARRLYHDPDTFQPSHLMVMFTNHLPRVGGTDLGTWSRITVLPFNHKWDRESQDVILDYATILFEQAGSAILQWLIDGAKQFLKTGGALPYCTALEAATDDYRLSEDWLMNFISESCEEAHNGRCGAQILYQAYRDWAILNGEHVRSQHDFNNAMIAKGFNKIAPKNRKTWQGIELKDNDYDQQMQDTFGP